MQCRPPPRVRGFVISTSEVMRASQFSRRRSSANDGGGDGREDREAQAARRRRGGGDRVRCRDTYKHHRGDSHGFCSNRQIFLESQLCECDGYESL